MHDLYFLLQVIQERVARALMEFTGSEPEVADLNSRVEPRKVPYARVGIAEITHSDFTVSSDSLMVGIQIVAVVSRNNSQPQRIQIELAEAIHRFLFGADYSMTMIECPSGRVARLIPATRTALLSDIEQAIAERMPDYTSVLVTFTAELPLGGKAF